jgi:hypothetical protein
MKGNRRSADPKTGRQKKAKKAVDTFTGGPYFARRSYWAGLQEP